MWNLKSILVLHENPALVPKKDAYVHKNWISAKEEIQIQMGQPCTFLNQRTGANVWWNIK